MKDSLTLPSLANDYFNSLRDQIDESICTYNDEYMRYFVRKSIKGGRCSASKQFFKSIFSDEVFNILSKDLDINGNICEILDEFFEFINKHRKMIETEYDSQFNDYRDINQDEKAKYVNDKLSNLRSFNKLKKKLDLKDVMMDFDATSLYPIAMWDD